MSHGVRTVTLGDGTTAENLNPLTYRGYVYDSETGLYYLQSRYYDPVVGRFINADGLVATGQGILGNNMFAYCQNSPIIFVDTSGYVIELSEDATDEEKEQYERAIAYLMQSESGRALIEKLQNSSIIFTVEFHNKQSNKYCYNSHTISVNINYGMVIKDENSVMSAAICLAHEMGHAALHLDGDVDTSLIGNEHYDSLIEWINLRKYENPIAMELGEPIRWEYKDGLYKIRMRDSTHYRKKPTYIDKLIDAITQLF